MGTHKIIANNILVFVDSDLVQLIDEKKFIWGNIKPDYVSKYKLKKHYYNESIEMILNKIYFLSSMSVQEVVNIYGKKKFSAELGVVCHFLCDYFCLAHKSRWRFKSAMKKHVLYEKHLASIAKEFCFNNFKDDALKVDDVEKFIGKYLAFYEKDQGSESDLIYAMFICNTIVNMLLKQVHENNSLMRAAV